MTLIRVMESSDQQTDINQKGVVEENPPIEGIPENASLGKGGMIPPSEIETKSRETSPQNEDKIHPVVTVTNFFIEDILRPDFGVKKDRKPSLVDTYRQYYVNRSYHTEDKSGACSSVSSNFDTRTCSDTRHNDNSSLTGSRDSRDGCLQRHHDNHGTDANLPSPSDKSDDKVDENGVLWPAWVYCTRYSDRPSSGPRSRKMKKKERKPDEKRPRTAFTNEQLSRLKKEFDMNRYLTEQRRQELSEELKLNESQIKIWFQNKRAKLKKNTGVRNGLALHLMAQGLYNHSTSADELEIC